jgi:uncharacterized protein (TIGR02246 family)
VSFSEVESRHDEVLQVVKEMNAAWADQDLSRCLSYFSEDTDFENSYGWFIRGREPMGQFLQWLFEQYPKRDSVNERTSSTAEFLTPELAVVEAVRMIPATNSELPTRTFRATHHLRREDGTWLIWKTRIWELRLSRSTPLESVAPSRFPEFFID